MALNKAHILQPEDEREPTNNSTLYLERGKKGRASVSVLHKVGHVCRVVK